MQVNDKVVKEEVTKYYIDNFKIGDEDFYSDLEIEDSLCSVGKYACVEFEKEKKLFKITYCSYYYENAFRHLKEYYEKHPSTLSGSGKIVLNEYMKWMAEYLVAREMYEWLLFKFEGLEPIVDKSEDKEKLSLAMKHFFAMSYLEDKEGRDKREWLSKFIDREPEYGYPTSMINYANKLIDYRNKNFAGVKKNGNELLVYRDLFKFYKDGKYDEGIEYLIKSVVLEDKRYITVQDYEEFVKEYHPENIKKENSQPISELEKNALLFLWDDCKMLRHTYPDKYTVDDTLLCMYNAVHSFMQSGSKDDAIDIYNCYSRRFLKSDKMQEFINMISSYESNASRLVQSHRDHYSHSAYVFILGMAIYYTDEKCRDAFIKKHFGKFKLGDIPEDSMAGNALLECSIFDFYCGPEAGGNMNFLRLWGLTALFHDIGYQYEIPFEQIKNTSGSEIYFQYKNFDKYNNFNTYFTEYVEKKKGEEKVLWDENSRIFKDIKEYKKRLFLCEETEEIQSYINSNECAIEEIIAYHIRRFIKREYSAEFKKENLAKNNGTCEEVNDKEYSDLGYIAKLLKLKPTPKGPYMDHAYFSGIITFREIFAMYGPDEFPVEFMDAITAIIMHNKFFELCLKDSKPLGLNEHPLAYLLILCDELQCWDRTSFGKGSIQQMHAIDAKLKFEQNKGLEVEYIYDKRFAKDSFEFNDDGTIKDIAPGSLGKFYMYKDSGNKLKFTPEGMINGDIETYKVEPEDYSEKEIACDFWKGIADIVDLEGEASVNLLVGASFGEKDKLKKEYLTETSIRNLYATAKNLYEKVNVGSAVSFEYTTLMEKLAYISFVKSIGEGLHKIGCFYTNKPKVFDVKEEFSEDDKAAIFNVEKEMLDGFCMNHLIEKFKDEDIAKMVDECISILVESRGIEIYKLW